MKNKIIIFGVLLIKKYLFHRQNLMSKAKNVKIEKVIKSDASYEIFTYFRSLLEMSCLDEHFAKANLALLSLKTAES